MNLAPAYAAHMDAILNGAPLYRWRSRTDMAGMSEAWFVTYWQDPSFGLTPEQAQQAFNRAKWSGEIVRAAP